MGKQLHVVVLLVFFLSAGCLSSQVNSLIPDAEKERKFSPYMVYNHGGKEGLEDFKKSKPHEYLKELWYYSESFYIKRDHFEKGSSYDESMLDVARYEHLRKEEEETIITLWGYRDVIVLLPSRKLLFNPTVK